MTKPQEAPATRCSECRRPITSAASLARGMGPLCAARNQAAAALTTSFKNAEAASAKALQLITDKGIVRTRHLGQYLAVASTGDQNYLVDVIEGSCTCQARGHCYHQVAANICEITATRRNAAYALAA